MAFRELIESWRHLFAFVSFAHGVLVSVGISVVYLFVFFTSTETHYLPTTNVGTFEFFNGMVHIFLGSFVTVIYAFAVICMNMFGGKRAPVVGRWSVTECATATFTLYGVVSAVVGIVLAIWYLSLFYAMSPPNVFAGNGEPKAVLEFDAAAAQAFGWTRLAVAAAQLAWGIIVAVVLTRFYTGDRAPVYSKMPTADVGESLMPMGAPMFGGAPVAYPSGGGFAMQTARQRLVGAPAAAASRVSAATAAANEGAPGVAQATLSRLFEGTA